MHPARDITGYRKHWAARFGTAPFLPMSRAEMDALGWEQCDVIIVTGDAYVDHPSFGMAIIGRVLEAQGLRVGIIAQPDWHSAEPFARARARRDLFFGITAGNMDSMVNRYTADRRRAQRRRLHARRASAASVPIAAVIVYAQRVREAYQRRADRDRRHRGVAAPHRALRLLVGEGAPLGAAGCARRTCWCTAMASAQIVRDRAAPRRRRAHRRHHATCAARRSRAAPCPSDWIEIDSTHLDAPGPLAPPVDPYAMSPARSAPAPAAPSRGRRRRRGARWCASCAA